MTSLVVCVYIEALSLLRKYTQMNHPRALSAHALMTEMWNKFTLPFQTKSRVEREKQTANYLQ